MHDEDDNYFIKMGYRSQERNFASSQKDAAPYWTEERILFSLNFHPQYDVYRFARDIIGRRHVKTVIDVGCGIAAKLMELIYPVCRDIVGVDQEEAIRYCRRSYDAGTFVVDDLEHPSSSPGTFDLIISADVIEHLLDPDRLLEYVKDVSREDSVIVLSTPERDIIRGRNCMASSKPEHVREWNRHEFRTYLQNRGFKVLEHKLVHPAKFSFSAKVSGALKSMVVRKPSKTEQVVLCRIN